jgi:hypothetical protein
MLRRPHGRARVNEDNPQAWGRCDRCSFLYNLRDLHYQYEVNGLTMLNTRLRVCEECMDNPNFQFQNIPLPADPLPKRNARPEPYLLDEVDYLTTQDYTPIATQDGQPLTPDQASSNYFDVPQDPNRGPNPPNSNSED